MKLLNNSNKIFHFAMNNFANENALFELECAKIVFKSFKKKKKNFTLIILNSPPPKNGQKYFKYKWKTKEESLKIKNRKRSCLDN